MSRQRILVVDDEPLNVEYLDQELSDRGYIVDRAYDGYEAIAHVADERPDLILLDVLMPGLDGIEACRRLKNDVDTQRIPIVIMTALSDMDSRVRGIEAGADDFLTKPVDERELFARIRTALRMKAAVDDTVQELESATQQIARLGSHDEDVTVIAVLTDEAGDRERIREEVESAGGIVTDDPEGISVGIFRGTDPAVRARRAIEAAAAMHSPSWGVGVAEGSALIGVDRSPGVAGHEWAMTVEGPAVADAVVAARSATPGDVLVVEAIRDQLADVYEIDTAMDASGLALFNLLTDVAPEDAPGPHEVRLPSEFGDLLPIVHDRWHIADLYATRVLSGKSGAHVLVVDISCDGFSGQAILKLERHEQPLDDVETEAGRHHRAIEHDPTYAAAHLPRLVHLLSHGTDTATLSTIAAGGLEYCQPWFRSPYEQQLAAGERISHDMLESWNASYELARGLVLPSQLLQRWLQHRIDRGESRLDSVLEDIMGVSHDAATFFLNGEWYPNPVVFARGDREIAAEPPLRAAVGQVHGDLHGYNILTSHGRTDVSDYFLIDLAFYEDDSYLFFDHGYLELSYLLRTREDASPSRWLEVLDGVVADSPVSADDIGVVRMVQAIRNGQRRWIDDHEPDRTSYMVSQMMLGQVGAGLNFANKRVGSTMKLHALLYAAAVLKQFIELHNIDWPLNGDAATLPVVGT